MKSTFLALFILWSCQFTFASIHDTIGKPDKLRISKPVRTDIISSIVLAKCDGCSSAGGGSMGFSSILNSNFVGVRYIYQSYSSRDGIFENSPLVDENFNTIQLWSRIPISNRFQLMALVPYHFHDRQHSTTNEKIAGIGDITVLGIYTVFKTKKDSVVYKHKVQFGAGIKTPTGKYDSANNLSSVNPSFQVGTGSWDYLISTEYVVSRKSLGLNVMVTYSIKTENEKEYQFGNQFNYSGSFFYLLNANKLKIIPQMGIAGEVFGPNIHYDQELPNSSGNILFAKYGLELGRKRFGAGINFMQPINQNLMSGKVEANYRLSVNLNYSL